MEYLDFAIELARSGGDVLKHYMTREKEVELKSRANLVAVADKESEALIIRRINERYPHHAVLAEESGASGSGFGTLIQTSQRADSLLNFNLAKLFAANGDKERAVSYLYKAVEEGFKDLEKIKTEPAFAVLAEDVRYQQLIDTMLVPR